jgi:hypothetical protein
MLTWQSCTEKVGANYRMSRHLPAADAIRTKDGRSFRKKQRCRLSPATASLVKSLERPHTVSAEEVNGGESKGDFDGSHNL